MTAGGAALQGVLGQGQERYHLGEPLFHAVPGRSPRQGQRGGRVRLRQGRSLAQGRLHLGEQKKIDVFFFHLKNDLILTYDTLVFKMVF